MTLTFGQFSSISGSVYLILHECAYINRPESPVHWLYCQPASTKFWMVIAPYTDFHSFNVAIAFRIDRMKMESVRIIAS